MSGTNEDIIQKRVDALRAEIRRDTRRFLAWWLPAMAAAFAGGAAALGLLLHLLGRL